MAKLRSKSKTSQQINILLKKAREEFAKGKRSVTFKLSNTSKDFLSELQKTAYDKYCYTVKKKFFGRVKIINGIIYEYPF